MTGIVKVAEPLVIWVQFASALVVVQVCAAGAVPAGGSVWSTDQMNLAAASLDWVTVNVKSEPTGASARLSPDVATTVGGSGACGQTAK